VRASAVGSGLSGRPCHDRDALHRDVSSGGGIDPLVVVVNDMSWSFLVVPVGMAALLLAMFAFIWHNIVAPGPNKGDTWPIRWW